MIFEWDDAKNAANRAKHGVGFDAAWQFDWNNAYFTERSRLQDGEQRFIAVGSLFEKLHTVVFTHRGHVTRIISFRRSNKQEEKAYEKNTRTR